MKVPYLTAPLKANYGASSQHQSSALIIYWIFVKGNR